MWRLYPKRSITSHRFCGSGRLFPGLRSETRRAEIGMTGTVVMDDVINSGREQAYLSIFPLSRELCRKCTNFGSFCKSHLPVRSQTAKRVQNGQSLLISLQAGGGRREAGGGRSEVGRGGSGGGRRQEGSVQRVRRSNRLVVIATSA